MLMNKQKIQFEVGPRPPQPPYRVQIKLSKSQGCFRAKEPARAHNFNAKIYNSNGPPCNAILAIMG